MTPSPHSVSDAEFKAAMVRANQRQVERIRSLEEQLEAAESRLNSGVFMGKPVDYWLGLQEQLEALKRQADLDAERAAILSSAVGRARLILGDASKETTALIDAALASSPATSSGTEPVSRREVAGVSVPEASSPASSPYTEAATGDGLMRKVLRGSKRSQ